MTSSAPELQCISSDLKEIKYDIKKPNGTLDVFEGLRELNVDRHPDNTQQTDLDFTQDSTTEESVHAIDKL
jgi:hypothetical protein